MRRMPSWSQKIEARTFPADFCTLNFLGWGGVSRYAATPLAVALSVGHSDINRFCPWLPIAPDRKSFGSHRKNSKSCSDDWHRWCFWSAFRHFGTHFAESFCMSKSSWMMDPTCLREMPNCSTIDLAKIWWSSKISLWILSVISGVVSVLGHPGWVASQVENSPRLNWATQFLTVAYDGACSPNVSCRIVWICFSALLCREKNLMAARVSVLLKSCTSRDILPFSLCNKKKLAIQHMKGPLFPTTLSILSYDIEK